MITAPAAGCPVTLSVTVPVTRQPAGSVTTTSAGSALAVAGRLGVVRVEHGECCVPWPAIRRLVDGHSVEFEPALGVRRRREETRDRPVVDRSTAARSLRRPVARRRRSLCRRASTVSRAIRISTTSSLPSKMEEADSDRPVVGETEDRIVQAIEVVFRTRRYETGERDSDRRRP